MKIMEIPKISKIKNFDSKLSTFSAEDLIFRQQAMVLENLK